MIHHISAKRRLLLDIGLLSPSFFITIGPIVVITINQRIIKTFKNKVVTINTRANTGNICFLIG